MFLQDYISKISTEKKHLREKYWLNSEALLSHFNKENIPDNKIEEWKNFKTGFLKKRLFSSCQKNQFFFFFSRKKHFFKLPI